MVVYKYTTQVYKSFGMGVYMKEENLIYKLRERRPLTPEELSKDISEKVGVTIDVKTLENLEENGRTPNDSQMEILRKYANKTGRYNLVPNKVVKRSSSERNNSNSCSGPIGPGYHVGSRRFDLDGLPAMD